MEKLKSQVAGSYSSSSEAHNVALRELQAARVREDALTRHLEKAREEEAAAKAKHSDLSDDIQVGGVWTVQPLNRPSWYFNRCISDRICEESE
jgi:Arc/MetJ-type ribon-helix-helix transcriptional regulator